MTTLQNRLDDCFSGKFGLLGELSTMEIGAMCIAGFDPTVLTRDEGKLLVGLKYALLAGQFGVADAIFSTGVNWRANDNELLRVLAHNKLFDVIAAIADESDLAALCPGQRKRVAKFIKRQKSLLRWLA